jgi:hypothetical protein
LELSDRRPAIPGRTSQPTLAQIAPAMQKLTGRGLGMESFIANKWVFNVLVLVKILADTNLTRFLSRFRDNISDRTRRFSAINASRKAGQV